MTISRHLEIVICSAKSKSPARNLCQENELQNRGVEDGFANRSTVITGLLQQVFTQTFSQHQLFAILSLRLFFKTDYRGIEQILYDFGDLRQQLKLKRVPDHSTLQKAEARLLKKGLLKTC